MSLQAEQNVIGSLLLRNECLDEIDFLTPDMFQVHGNLFAECSRLIREGHTVDAQLLAHSIATDSYPMEYASVDVGECVRDTFSSTTVRTYARIILTEYRAKQFRETLNRMTGDPKRLEAEIQTLTDELDAIRLTDGITSKTLPQIVRENKDKYFVEQERPRVETGLPKLDDILGGFEGGDLIIIGARPAVGKSAFATQITSHFASVGKKVGYFNLEMQEKQVYERFVSARSGIGVTRIRRAVNFQGDEEERFQEANEFLERQEGIIITTGSKSISEIRADAKRQNYDVVVIDYLQLVRPDVRYASNRYAEVGAISHAAKSLAMEMNIPVIGLCQLNRTSSGGKEPSMGELRESGDFEQDASVILLLWNTEKDDPTRKCIKVEKQRQGKTGKVELMFDGGRMRFEEDDGFRPVDEPVFEGLVT